MSKYYTKLPDVKDGDIAYAADVNDINDATDVALEQVEADFSTVGDEVAADVEKARQWAEEAEDVEVEAGSYSAYNWSIKSNDSAVLSEASASAASTSELAAASSASGAAASETQTALDLIATNQDTIDTAADLVATGLDVDATDANVVLTNADAAQTALDRIATNQDTIDTAADLVATNQDTIDTAADLVATNQDTIDTAADRVQTGLDRVATAADVVSSDTSATEAQLEAWVAEAERLTADSYATEAAGTPVNIVTSDGDGSFTYTPTTDYSSLHWAAKSSEGASVVTLEDTTIISPTDGQALTYDTSTSKWINEDIPASINNLVEDLTPQLGGDLECSGRNINQSTYNQIADATLGTGIHTFNYSAGDMQQLTVTGDITIAFSYFWTGKVCTMILDIVNGGDWTITYPTGMVFSGGVEPTLTSGGTDRILVIKDKDEVYSFLVVGTNIGVAA